MNVTNGTTASGTQACAYEYTVKRGDSYYLISKRLGVPLRDLIAANPGINPARLMVGDVLCIPGESTQQIAKEPAPTPPVQVEPPVETPPVEVVPPEATLPETSLPETAPPEVEMPPAFLCPLAQRRTVQPGQSASDFQLSSGLNRHTLEVSNPNVDLDNLVPGQVICVPDVNQPCPLPASYILKENDTLETVAAKFNVSIASLLRANPCLAPADFLPCVCVSLPR